MSEGFLYSTGTVACWAYSMTGKGAARTATLEARDGAREKPEKAEYHS